MKNYRLLFTNTLTQPWKKLPPGKAERVIWVPDFLLPLSPDRIPTRLLAWPRGYATERHFLNARFARFTQKMSISSRNPELIGNATGPATFCRSKRSVKKRQGTVGCYPE